MNDWYEISGNPGTKAHGSSASMRAEFVYIQAAFGKMPVLTGSGGNALFVSIGGTSIESVTDDIARERLGLVIGESVQAFSEVLQNTTASFTTEMQSKTESVSTQFVKEHDEETGLHKLVTLPVMESDPSPSSEQLSVYSKMHEGVPAFFVKIPGMDPLRLTNENGQLAVILDDIDLKVGSIRTNSFSRGKVIDVYSSGGITVIDWDQGTVFRLTITENTEIQMVNMPSMLADEEQCIYLDVIDGGNFDISLTSGYLIEPPGGVGIGLTEDGRDYIVCASNNGYTITTVPIYDLRVPV